MGYSTPRMNLTANVWSASSGPPGPPRLNTPAQLRGHHKPELALTLPEGNWQFCTLLCVPAGTDLRDSYTVSGKDLIECPAGSGRIYECLYVDDVAKGFANEWRFALLAKVGQWPTPIA